jgi:hypothetical protein
MAQSARNGAHPISSLSGVDGAALVIDSFRRGLWKTSSPSTPKMSSKFIKVESLRSKLPALEETPDPLLECRAMEGRAPLGDRGVRLWCSSQDCVQKSTTWPSVFRACSRIVISGSKKHWKRP